MLVVLNDNDMSISATGGRVEQAPGAADQSGKHLHRRARGRQERAEAIRRCMSLPSRFEEHTKGMVVPGTIFEEIRLQLCGPDRRPRPRFADPHAGKPARQARAAVPPCRHQEGPGLQAGRGRPGVVPRAASSKFNPAEGIVKPAAPRQSPASPRSSASGCATWPRPTPSVWWASPLPCAKARAWSSSTSRFPGRYHDVGIAEQHAVTFAAGMACEGLKPVVAIYSAPSCSAATTS